MGRNKAILTSLLISSILIFGTHQTSGQTSLDIQIKQIAEQISGNVGVHSMLLETGDTISYNGNKRFPMQSVYKFPIAMAVFAKVDRDKLSLKKQHKIETSDYIPKTGYSPLRDKFPNGIQLSLEELLYFNIESDGTACDVLLKLLGGNKKCRKIYSSTWRKGYCYRHHRDDTGGKRHDTISELDHTRSHDSAFESFLLRQRSF